MEIIRHKSLNWKNFNVYYYEKNWYYLLTINFVD